MMIRCCRKEPSHIHRVYLTFSREALLYDVKNYAYVESHVMSSESEHARHMVADVGEEGNVDRVTRVLDLSVSLCRELLYPYAKKSIVRVRYEDKLCERAEYKIVLQVPDSVSQTTLTLLERLIHEFLVCRSVADWLSLTHREKSEVWLMKAAEAESEIRTCLQTRMQRVRVVPHWMS